MVDRRTVLAAGGGLAAAWVAADAMPVGARTADTTLGSWAADAQALPAYRYTGPLRFAAADGVPDDPWFLLGNHRITAFVHASGRLRLLSGERGWAAMNGRGGAHGATLDVDGAVTGLIGPDAPAAARAGKLFGVGTARFDYAAVGGIAATRRVAVAPSPVVGTGTAALLVTIELRNDGIAARHIGYAESFGAAYAPIVPPWSDAATYVRHVTRTTLDSVHGVARADTETTALRPLALPPRPAASRFDAEPPTLWVAALEGCRAAADTGVGIVAAALLAPGATLRLRFAVGHSFAANTAAIRATASTLAEAAIDGAFARAWRDLVPRFADEPDPVLRRELQWHAATLEAMATWREYYDETVVPQGSTYDYVWGLTASSRDLAQHALPLCTLRPALARSVTRYIFKRTGSDGEVALNDEGYGWVASGPMRTSDQQLYLFLLVAEYLRATDDSAILTDRVAWHPAEAGSTATGLAHLHQAFLYLRDRVCTGPHGLVKLWNSDWNDLFYHWPSAVPYNELFDSAESHMNSAMAIVVLGDLAGRLDRHPAAAPLAAAMRAWRDAIDTRFVADLGARAFPRRAWLGRAGAVGETAMWLEPQGFTLLGSLPEPRRRRLWAQLKARLLAGEALGPRQIEAGPPQRELRLGQRENGGFWYALAGPVILGVARFDPDAAWALLRGQTLDAFARHYPAVWTGQWTAADSIDAATVPSAGHAAMEPWCAHAHAWPLYAYLKLRDLRTTGR